MAGTPNSVRVFFMNDHGCSVPISSYVPWHLGKLETSDSEGDSLVNSGIQSRTYPNNFTNVNGERRKYL
jgi:hypothetical protein